MTEPFTKLLGSILSSTVWLEDHETRIVWVTMLAMANADGYVGASVPGLAHQARVPVEAVRKALAKFQAPDPDSRTKAHGGRRIEEVDRGWVLLNYRKIRDTYDQDEKRRKDRERKRRDRSALSADVRGCPALSAPVQNVAQAEAEADTEGEEEVEGEGEATAPTPPYIHKKAPAALLDPVAAAHSPAARSVADMEPPRACRRWGPGDLPEIHRQITAHGGAAVMLVARFVHMEIEAGHAEPKVWSHLWRFDGEPFERWAQKYAEASSREERIQKRQEELERAERQRE